MPVRMESWIKLLSNHALWIGLALRIGLAWLLPFLLDDGRLIPGVSYTDIDYHIFSDAAQHVLGGGSPFDRHTYRYTPFLAAMLAYSHGYGRYIFCVADALCGWIIIRLRRDARKKAEESEKDTPATKFQDALYWMYNPLAINICTRGSAESFMVLLPVLVTVSLVQMKSHLPIWTRAILAGIVHGLAVHSKLYPIIYSLSFMAHFGTSGSLNVPSKGPSNLLQIWFWRLLRPASILFFISFLISFVSLTYLAVLLYGREALDEGLLYHFSRVDHRHNYSIFWYGIYLARDQAASSAMNVVGRLLLLPQLVLLVYTSLGIAPNELSLALFCQTYLFVTLNKVITAQYFTWYLCLLPLCSHAFSLTRKVQQAVIALVASVVFWLANAYCLEMQGMAVHRLVWFASVLYFAANIQLLCALLQSYADMKNLVRKKNE
jgi:GPI mannosyltransferase 1 subunit M